LRPRAAACHRDLSRARSRFHSLGFELLGLRPPPASCNAPPRRQRTKRRLQSQPSKHRSKAQQSAPLDLFGRSEGAGCCSPCKAPGPMALSLLSRLLEELTGSGPSAEDSGQHALKRQLHIHGLTRRNAPGPQTEKARVAFAGPGFLRLAPACARAPGGRLSHVLPGTRFKAARSWRRGMCGLGLWCYVALLCASFRGFMRASSWLSSTQLHLFHSNCQRWRCSLVGNSGNETGCFPDADMRRLALELSESISP